ncbi:hypothetical protein AM571_PA00172 (plasmid) [Rhizobium etli 8C-3]|uniref:Uncharacterized protein n=1 Tax=Rhizobium etli 8C-3 TaxID=538025 RepID=A0A1L5PA65_RHIET|nr:hypothetical protein AM571_PA00172 [Rhizobium etli 8C-3]
MIPDDLNLRAQHRYALSPDATMVNVDGGFLPSETSGGGGTDAQNTRDACSPIETSRNALQKVAVRNKKI